MRRRSFVNHFLEFFYIFVSQSREVARLRGQLASVALRGTGDQISKNHFTQHGPATVREMRDRLV